MARKAWDQLSDAYRARLSRAGITAQSHTAGASLRYARGHGLHTPSSRRHDAEVRERRIARLSEKDIVKREQLLGYIKLDSTVAMIDAIGTDRASIVLAWQEYRHQLWEDGGRRVPVTPSPMGLEQFAGDRWDDTFEEWYDDAYESDAGFVYYH